MSNLLNTFYAALTILCFVLILEDFTDTLRGWAGILLGIVITVGLGLGTFVTFRRVICDLQGGRSYVKAFILAALRIYVVFVILVGVSAILYPGIWLGFRVGIPLIGCTALVVSLIGYESYSRRAGEKEPVASRNDDGGQSSQ